jgi:hypothetical protein
MFPTPQETTPVKLRHCQLQLTQTASFNSQVPSRKPVTTRLLVREQPTPRRFKARVKI